MRSPAKCAQCPIAWMRVLHHSLSSSSFHTNSREYLQMSRYLCDRKQKLAMHNGHSSIQDAQYAQEHDVQAGNQPRFSPRHYDQQQGRTGPAPPSWLSRRWLPHPLAACSFPYKPTHAHTCSISTDTAMQREAQKRTAAQRTRFLSMISCRLSYEGPK